MKVITYAQVFIGSAGAVYTLRAGVYLSSIPRTAMSKLLIPWGLAVLFILMGMHGAYKMAISNK